MRYITFLFFLAILACKPKTSEYAKSNEFPISKSISGVRNPISDQINRSFEIITAEDKLIVSDKKDEYLFTVFDLTTNELTTHFGQIGQGPCEFEFPTSLQLIHSTDGTIELALFNRSRWRFQTLDFSTFDCISTPSKPLDFNFQKVVWVRDSLFFGIGIFPNKYAIINQNESKATVLDIPYPFNDENLNLSPNIAMNQQGDIFLKPDRSKILVTSNFSPFFDIIDAHDFKVIKRMEGWAPSVLDNENSNIISTSLKRDNKFGFISSSVTDEKIYLLYSGKNFDNNPYSSNKLHIYDWDGNRIEEIQLNIEVEQIAVSQDGKKIYTYHDDGEANIFQFDLE
ncbi:TolB-like 6-bladed beta-propeller domain-containing protein [Algoriphagus halophytocola]|uniref:TolB-like 6-bladed beta-propeller domain-containing protein n=1 Tax=Algoriphagus halophytocola TaxID=2991499 RepID=A0ABY6MDI0_9BACT|nr:MULTISPECIES: TolB-like 6-bladed beta-propeller domain-containing protein [unclassified Algoriphagus]UZD20939.1 TolB-like 6-bladed beta-propeller domain-containing protein [Algoriphagus sp. TR-M5]WBL42105.1 TolB-like 6-bladed beta-propeller domain-containing protein [Algoriphagus sp. TR-M9]